MKAAPRWQAMVFGLCVAFAIAGQSVFALTLGQQIWLLAPLVAVLGLPHGALDLPIAQVLWPLETRAAKLGFVGIYLGVVGAVVALWMVFPGLGLIAFLGYSMFHFADDWAFAKAPLRWAGGFATIGATALFHTDDVAALFGYLAPAAFAVTAANLLALTGAAALVMFFASLVLQPENRNQTAVEQAIIWIAAFSLPPLIFFVVYFCGLHSVRHFSATLLAVPKAGPALLTAGLLSCLVIAAAGLIWLVLDKDAAFSGQIAGLQIVFIGLAALTVPHMLLVERFHRRA